MPLLNGTENPQVESANTEVKEEIVNQNPTPEEIAAKIIEEMKKTFLVEIDYKTNENLLSLAKYNNRDKIQMRGETYFNKSKDFLMREVIEKLINDKHETIVKYLRDKEKKGRMEYFLLLRSKGMSIEDAEKAAGLNQE